MSRPASPHQVPLWDYHRIGQSQVHNLAVGVRWTGEPLDAGTLRWAATQLVRRHPMLRATFFERHGRLAYRISEASALEVNRITLPDGDDLEPLERLCRETFDLERGPILRLHWARRPGGDLILLTTHYIAADPRSCVILLRELGRLASARLCGVAPDLPDPGEYDAFVSWHDAWLQGEEGATARKHWASCLAGLTDEPRLPLDRARPAVSPHRGAACAIEVEAHQQEALRRLAEALSVTPDVPYLAALFLLLRRYNASDDLLVGRAVAARPERRFDTTVGAFMNLLPIRTLLTSEMTTSQAVAEVHQTVERALPHRHFPFWRIEALKALQRDGLPTFQVSFAYDDFPDAGAGGELVPFPAQEGVSDLFLHVVRSASDLQCRLCYDTGLLHAETARRMATHYREILLSLLRKEEVSLGSLKLRELSRPASAPRPARAAGSTFVAELAVAVDRWPENTAVVDGERRISYRELDRDTRSIAGGLTALGVAREAPVAVIAEPSLDLVRAMVGILRAGGAYVPIDPLLPPERVRSIVRTAGCAAVIVTEERDVADPGCRVLSLEQLTGSAPDGDLPEVTGDQLAYILFTSGSTGTPKGVMVEHRALGNLCGWHRRYYEVSSRDRATLYARPGFDASIWEMTPYLTAGAALHVVPEAIRLDVHELGRFMRRQGITIAFLPTPICEEFLSVEETGLERLLTGGDRLRRARHRGEYRLFNNYGPTETTVVATACEIAPDASSVPIGKPIDNLTAHILDLDGNIAPLGVPGELCVGGVGLARGYLGDPELTARCFMEHPVAPGERLYHTGDLCRWLPDGNLEFCGRIDHQVKIRGYRIELGEVESCLLAIDTIRSAVVLPRKGSSADSLVAYLVAEGSPAPADLQRQLAVKLPEYMIPSLFVQVDRIPLTRNGKVDVAALRERAERTEPAAPPAVSGLDGEVVQIWQEVLEYPDVAGEHRFFDVGGNSIRMLQLFQQVSERYGVDLAPDLFMEQNPSLTELTAMVRAGSQPS